MSYVKANDIENYFNELDRALFMPSNKHLANIDAPFPIGHGQTISQPSLVLKMTLMLGITDDSRILEIGTGSGYQTALLAKFASRVYTVERIEPLQNSAKEILSELGFTNIKFKIGDGSQGWEEEAPFDRILVTAAAHRIPRQLIRQLAPGGGMIIPVGEYTQRINIISKDEDNNVSIREDIPVIFVKLIGDY